MKQFAFFLLVFSSLTLFSQKDRYRFAATYVGLESELSLENNSFSYFKNGVLNSSKLPSSVSPRILIGGTHFWGNADFYISIPVGKISINQNDNIKLTNDVLTGFRFLPFKLKSKSLRPFFGTGFNSKELQLKNGPVYTNWQWFYETGLNYKNGNKIFGLEMRYFSKNEYLAAISRTDLKPIHVSPLSFSFSYKILFDGTAGYSSESSKKYMKSIYEKAEKSGALSTFSFGIGLSALIPLDKTELASRHAFFNDEIDGNLFPELGIAYYSNPLNASIRVSYRPLKQEESAYNYTYRLRRHALSLEAFKFVGDYHGFVPFIGPYISADNYRLKETDHGKSVIDEKTNKLGYGIVFGWDIKQTDVDYITLRTNLRYTPEFNYKSNGLKFTSEQLEFNFIQLVYYPERHKLHKQKN